MRMIGLLGILTIELNECSMTQGFSTPLFDTAGFSVLSDARRFSELCVTGREAQREAALFSYVT